MTFILTNTASEEKQFSDFSVFLIVLAASEHMMVHCHVVVDGCRGNQLQC